MFAIIRLLHSNVQLRYSPDDDVTRGNTCVVCIVRILPNCELLKPTSLYEFMSSTSTERIKLALKVLAQRHSIKAKRVPMRAEIKRSKWWGGSQIRWVCLRNHEHRWHWSAWLCMRLFGNTDCLAPPLPTCRGCLQSWSSSSSSSSQPPAPAHPRVPNRLGSI